MEHLNGLIDAVQNTGTQLSEQTARMIIVLVLFILGWLAATVVRKLFTKILKWLRIEPFAERFGVEQFLLKGGVPFTTTTILSQAVYWAFLFFVLLTGLNFLGLSIGSELLNRVLAFVPKVITAFVILLIGLVVTRFTRSVLSAYLNNLRIVGAEIISKVAHFTLMVLVLSMVLEHLQVGGKVLVTTFYMAFGALCLAVGLSFGLAGRKHARHILEKVFGQ